MGRLLAVWACAPVIALACVSAASALTPPTPYVRAFADDSVDPNCDSGNVPDAANCTLSFTETSPLQLSSTAIGKVSAAGGVVDASAVSGGYYFNGASGAALATSTLSDVLTFHGPLVGDAVITMAATVTTTPDFTNPKSNGHEFGFTEAYTGFEGVDTLGQEVAQGVDCTPGANTNFCSTLHLGTAVITNVGTSYSITETFDLSSNPVLGVLFFAGAASVGDGSAIVVDPITIQLPPGVTYTSASGKFLTGSVPEPATWAGLICGLGLTGAALRRRRYA
jgi:hypothetical protein